MLSKIKQKAISLYLKGQKALKDIHGEGYVDFGVKIIIAVVIGALLLGLLYTLFTTVIQPSLTEKVTGLFSYSG